MDQEQHRHSALSRRRFGQALAVGSLAIGFDAGARTWVTSAQDVRRSTFSPLPSLAGSLRVDAQTLRAYAQDYGQIVRRRPLAVLQPGALDDVTAIVRFARDHGLQVAARGHGHQPFGQAQVSGGIVIDMRSLGAVDVLAEDRLAADAGADWRAVLKASLARGRTPPVLTNYLGLTVGGTLSIGGIGVATLRHGAQVDQVCALEVVTGEGEVLCCSERERAGLFEAALAGQGQCAILARAELRLVEARPMVREYLAQCDDLSTLLAGLHHLQAEQRVDGAVGLIAPTPQGWSYALQAVRYFTPPEQLDDALLTAGLDVSAGSLRVRDVGYLEYADAVPPYDPTLPHPDLGLMMPGSQAARLLGDALPRLHARDLGAVKAIRVFTWPRQRFTRALFRVPEAETCVYAALLRAETPDRSELARMLAGNRVLFELNRALGGTLYPYSALALSRGEWRQHHQAAWHTLGEAKRRYDPDNVFAAGPALAG